MTDQPSGAPRRRTIVVALFATVVAVAAAVGTARGIVATDAGKAFLDRYPGHGSLPAGAPVGFPGWVCWQHFFNLFLMALLIRSGLQAHYDRRQPQWTSRKDPQMTMVLSGWLHMIANPLWMLNGLVFVVLLAVTGQWMRLVPTSPEVLPNAVSAALQYASLNWPTETGWVNYNALQQLTYFTTVFVAAPLSMLTGLRQTIWPAGQGVINRVFTERIAHAVHFPVMGYFAAFIVVHVGLVLATGARRNLNHMFAANDTDSPAGLILFAIAVAVTAAAWIAARPFFLAPVAARFGEVD